jgi:hypothetical protein
MPRERTVAALLADLEAAPTQGLPQTEAVLRDLVVKAQPDLREVNEVAARLARRQAADRVKDLSKTTRRVVQGLVARALNEGWSDDLLARRIQEKVGLDSRYAEAVERFRAGQMAAGVPKGKVDQAAKGYARRLRAHRALVIARYEVAKVLNDAQRELWTQQQVDGDLSPYAVRVWQVHKDEKRCRICRGMNGKRASLRPDGGYMVAGQKVVGPPVHPQCRCYEIVVDEGILKTDPDLWGAPVDISKAITPGGRIGDDSSLNRSPKKNWVERAGGLPKYIRMVAHALIRGGKDRSAAIRMAVGIVRNWAEGKGNVSAKVQAAAAKAIAEWEAKAAGSGVSKSEQTTWNLEDYQEITAQLRADGHL